MIGKRNSKMFKKYFYFLVDFPTSSSVFSCCYRTFHLINKDKTLYKLPSEVYLTQLS